MEDHLNQGSFNQHKYHPTTCIKLLILCILAFSQLNLSGKNKNYYQDSLKVTHLMKHGGILASKSMYTEALDSFLLALQIQKNIYKTEESSKFANTYLFIASVYKNLGFYDLAIQYSKLAEQAYLAGYGKNYNRMALVYRNLGDIYRSKLNYNEALDYYKQQAIIYENQDKINRADIAGAYYDIAEIYFKIFKYNEALQAIQQHLNDADDIIKIYFLDLLGAIYQELNQTEKAIEYYQKAIRNSIDVYSEKDLNVAFEYLNFAYSLINIGKSYQAFNELAKAKSIISLKEKGAGIYTSRYYRMLGILNENKHVESKDMFTFKVQKNKNLLDAVDAYKKALQALNFPSDIESVNQLDTINNVSDFRCLELLKLIGNAYIEISNIYEGENNEKFKDNIDFALHYFKIAGSFLQRLRKEISGDENKILLAELEQSTFVDVVKTSYSAYKADSNFEYLQLAFQNAERLKSGSIFDQLEETLAKNNSLIPDSLLQLEKTINSKITAYTEQRYEETTSAKPDSAMIKSADSMLFQLKQQRSDLNNYLENNYSDYYDLKYSGSLLSVKDIQQRLKNNEVLIEYVLNETDTLPELYSILISRKSTKFIKQNIDNQFIKDIESTYHFMSDPQYMFTRNEDSKAFCIASYQLYQNLIKPFENDIQDKKIIIVPDGKLNYIAFDGLIDEMPDTTGTIPFKKLKYLITKNCINYTYSANLLYKFDDLRKKANNRVLAFAPEYNADTVTFENQKIILSPLPGVQKEVDNISNEIRTKAFVGADATETNFRKNVENYDILHLAMHAYINDSLPAFSRLAFAQDTCTQPDNDGWLNTADIYNLSLNARLTVLSACNTGSGTLRKGEGVMSLARGFLYAGCPSVIMTLWEVEDNSGTKIMSSFYKYLKKGKAKDEALRLAKLDYMNNANPRLAHPHYWLGYVNIGNSSPLFRSYDFYFFSLLILAFIGIIAEQIIRIKKARKKQA